MVDLAISSLSIQEHYVGFGVLTAVATTYLLRPDFLLGLYIDPENGGHMPLYL
jgi:hypothetical protein